MTIITHSIRYLLIFLMLPGVDKYPGSAVKPANALINFVLYNIHEVKIAENITGLKDTVIIFWENSRNSRWGKALRNKFILTGLIFFVWLLLFDQNNLSERRKSATEYNQLLTEKEYYLQKIREDHKRIDELKTNSDNLEKFAREQYLMKKDNEDIFVIVDE